MAYLYVLLLAAFVLAYWSERRTDTGPDEIPRKDIAFYFLAILLVFFMGLRSGMNDTASYIRAYENLVPFKVSYSKWEVSNGVSINWDIGANPFFFLYESFLKKFVTESANAFIFLSSFFTVGIYLHFLKRHSVQFGYSIFLMIALGVYGFTAGAIKQTMATAIALVALEAFIYGRKIVAAALLACAVLFHPYVIIFLVVPFFTDDIWNRKSLILLAGTLAAGAAFSTLVDQLLTITEAIGENYSAKAFEEGTGINVVRILVYLVVPVMTFIYRKEIREQNDRFLILSCNLSLLAACFLILSLNGGAYSLGRLARYFDLFQCLALPHITKRCIEDKIIKNVIVGTSIGFFLVYYLFYYKNYLEFGFFVDYFDHISVVKLIRNW